ncbi:hypothetical protein HDU76_011909 [Blyttiomyces sp. JEL0837]|nr:hypothetical protein HDU76_011909 [Blyttiomyces sp. JEL0837]
MSTTARSSMMDRLLVRSKGGGRRIRFFFSSIGATTNATTTTTASAAAINTQQSQLLSSALSSKLVTIPLRHSSSLSSTTTITTTTHSASSMMRGPIDNSIRPWCLRKSTLPSLQRRSKSSFAKQRAKSKSKRAVMNTESAGNEEKSPSSSPQPPIIDASEVNAAWSRLSDSQFVIKYFSLYKSGPNFQYANVVDPKSPKKTQTKVTLLVPVPGALRSMCASVTANTRKLALDRLRSVMKAFVLKQDWVVKSMQLQTESGSIKKPKQSLSQKLEAVLLKDDNNNAARDFWQKIAEDTGAEGSSALRSFPSLNTDYERLWNEELKLAEIEEQRASESNSSGEKNNASSGSASENHRHQRHASPRETLPPSSDYIPSYIENRQQNFIDYYCKRVGVTSPEPTIEYRRVGADLPGKKRHSKGKRSGGNGFEWVVKISVPAHNAIDGSGVKQNIVGHGYSMSKRDAIPRAYEDLAARLLHITP